MSHRWAVCWTIYPFARGVVGKERERLEAYDRGTLAYLSVTAAYDIERVLLTYPYELTRSLWRAISLLYELLCSRCIAILYAKNVDTEHALKVVFC